MNWNEGTIEGCRIGDLEKYADERGWISELFRRDEIRSDEMPAMGYISETEPGVVRGPHEHREQTDMFFFLYGSVMLYLWDSREDSPTFGARQTVLVGQDNPVFAIIPPGVVHAYRNMGDEPVLILNFPNRLYGGPGRSEPVDEIRHEDDRESPYRLD